MKRQNSSLFALIKVLYQTKALFLLIGFSPLLANAEENACLNGIEDTQPLTEHRGTGVFTLSGLVCERNERSFYINQTQTIADIDRAVASNFCRRYSGTEQAPLAPCDSSGRYDFLSYPERFEDFVIMMERTLERTIPNPLMASGENSPERTRAFMYLCTHKKLEHLKNDLQNATTEDQMREALNSMESLGLLGVFLNSEEGQSFLAQKDRTELKSYALQLFLNSTSTPLIETEMFISNFNLLSSQRNLSLHQEGLKATIQLGLTNYINQDPATLSTPILRLLTNMEFEGAQERLVSLIGGGAVQEGPQPASVGTESARPALAITGEHPNCEELDPITRAELSLVLGPVENFINSQASSGRSQFTTLINPLERWRWLRTNLADLNNWRKVEIQMNSLNSGANQDYGSGTQKLYCLINDVFASHQSLIQKVDQGQSIETEANELFEKINSVGGLALFPNLMGGMIPSLNETNLLTAINYLKEMEIGDEDFSDPQVRDTVRAWRRNQLTEVLDTHSDRTIMFSALEALGKDAEVDEEALLARYFRRNNDPEMRAFIINQYKSSGLFRYPRTNLQIVDTIQTLPEEERGPYLNQLTVNLSRINFNTQSFRNIAGSAEVGSVQVARLIASLRSQTGFDPDAQLARAAVDATLAAGGVEDDAPDNSPETVVVAPQGTKVRNDNREAKVPPHEIIPLDESLTEGGSGLGAPPSESSPFESNSAQKTAGRNAGSDIRQPVNLQPFPRVTDKATSPIKNAATSAAGGGVGTSSSVKVALDEIREAGEEIVDATVLNNTGVQVAQGSGGIIRSDLPEASSGPIPNEESVLGRSQRNLINGLSGLPTTPDFRPPLAAPAVAPPLSRSLGENNFNSGSFNSGYSRPDKRNSPNAVAKAGGEFDSRENSIGNEGDGTSPTGRELMNGIRDIRTETEALKERLQRANTTNSNLGNSSAPSIPTSPAVAPPSNYNPTPDDPQTIAEGGNPPATGPAQNIQTAAPNSNSEITGGGNRAPASASGTDASAVATTANPFSESLLSPYESVPENELSKIIQVRDADQKRLLMNYMAAKDSLSCPELRFVQDFYIRHVDNFLLNKRVKPWREYAILELDNMNFRFNYPGVSLMRNQIKETCEELAEATPATVGEGSNNRVPASEIQEKVPEDSQPAQEESGLFRQFLLKIGL